jgi:hypothetical protein
MRPLLLPPVVGRSDTRSIDDFGFGGFGSPRDGGQRVHKGLDFRGDPGAIIQFPLDARITFAWAYPDPLAKLRSIHLLGIDAYDGLKIKLLYATPSLEDGMSGKAGDPLGVLQDVAAYHQSHQVKAVMQNHTHFELYELVSGVWVLRDPVRFLKA